MNNNCHDLRLRQIASSPKRVSLRLHYQILEETCSFYFKKIVLRTLGIAPKTSFSNMLLSLQCTSTTTYKRPSDNSIREGQNKEHKGVKEETYGRKEA